MVLRDVINAIEDAAPFSWQASYDNSGIQIGSPEQEVRRGLVALDLTPAVMEEAIEKKCDLVITHHPLIFEGLKSITGATATETLVSDAIRNRIAVVSVHTNVDSSAFGVNYMLALKLGILKPHILRPADNWLKKLVTFCPVSHADKVRAALFEAGAGKIGEYDCCSFNVEGRGSFRAGDNANPYVGNIKELHYEKEERIDTIFPRHLQNAVLKAMISAHPYEEVAYDIYPLDNRYEKAGSGMVGELNEPVRPSEFIQMIKKTLDVKCIRHTDPAGSNIKKVALCGGSGSFLIPDAIKSGAQAFITSDIKYHQFQDAAGSLLLIDAGHYETEQHTKELIHDIIQKKMINFALLISEVDTNPVRYA